MDTSFEDCKNQFRETLLNFIWTQWCELGVSGGEISHLPWFIDPEPLIPFSLNMARYDPRVFDGILDWLIVNGCWINVQRLVTILQNDRIGNGPLLQAVGKTIMKHNKGNFRWKIIEKLRYSIDTIPHPLFILRGESWSSETSTDDIFLEYGFERSPLQPRSMSHQVPLSNPRFVIFMIRSLLGVNVRSDVVSYLILKGQEHPSQIARVLGFSQKQVQDTLIEMAQSPLVNVQRIGHRKDYSLDTERWFPFLFGKDSSPPVWIDWRSLVRGLSNLWIGIAESREQPINKYVASSIAREAMRCSLGDLLNSGIGVRIEDDQQYKAEQYLDIFIRDINRISDKLLSLREG